MLDFARIFADGGLATLGFVGLALAITVYNPRIWLNPRDVPPDIYAAAPPQTPREKMLHKLFLFPLLTILIVPPLASTMAFSAADPGSSFWLRSAHAFLVLLLPTLGDLLIIDWLLLNTLTPDFVILEGTSKALAGYKDYGFHLRAHLRQLPLQVLGALVMALIAGGQAVVPA